METIFAIGGSYLSTIPTNTAQCRGKCWTQLWQPRRTVVLRGGTVRADGELPCLKSMVAHWEKKYNDASKLEDIPKTDEGMDFMAPQAVSSGPADHIPTCGGKSDCRHGAEDVSDLRQQLGIV